MKPRQPVETRNGAKSGPQGKDEPDRSAFPRGGAFFVLKEVA